MTNFKVTNSSDFKCVLPFSILSMSLFIDIVEAGPYFLCYWRAVIVGWGQLLLNQLHHSKRFRGIFLYNASNPMEHLYGPSFRVNFSGAVGLLLCMLQIPITIANEFDARDYRVLRERRMASSKTCTVGHSRGKSQYT